MNVFIFTLGTRGDVQPYVALARGLSEAGHQTTLCTSARFGPFVRDHGVEFSDFNDEFMALVESPEGRSAMENSANPWVFLQNMRRLLKKSASMQRSMMRDGWKAARAANPDLILFHPKTYGGAHFAEKLGVPAVLAVAMPVMVPTREFPALGFPRWPLGRMYNRATHRLLLAFMRRMFAKFIDEWREENGLAPQAPGRDILHGQTGIPIHVLHAYSRHAAPVPSDWPATASVTGYWFLDRRTNWKPPSALTEFLRIGEPPVYVGFGSMSDRHAKERTTLVVQALEKANLRGVIASGWGGLSEFTSTSTILFIHDVPHDWLFPRMTAVVHHGGAGTTAAGLRAGRPAVICPFIADQPFWGQCLHLRGLSPSPIPQKRLTAQNLEAAIRRAVTDDSIRAASRAVAAKIALEDGVGEAARVLESIVRKR